ncbi:MAG: hypothetical protein HS111_21110 [Kofleriaceae bacterium]|nr:hypothetical protein [Kofleriaceae bacterium]MCL4223223.1 hypothetical protein [Myxococcales bacterium]
MRRSLVLSLCVAAVGGGSLACSGRTRDPGPTTRPEPAARVPVDGAAPARPPRPLDAARVEALAAVAIADHEVTVVRRGVAELAAVVTAADGTRVTVTASACLACTPIDLAAWQARQPELAALWAPAADAGDELALTAPTIGGDAVIAVDATRHHDGETRRTYQLHWNDGVTQLAAICEAASRAPPPGAAAGTAATGSGPAPVSACAPVTAAALAAYLAAL